MLLIDDSEFDDRFIKKIGKFEIYVDHENMPKFLDFVKKGYLKQAETALRQTPNYTKAHQFNQGLLYLLSKKPREAYNTLKDHQTDSHNCQMAMEMLNMK
jgi:hypothetical protein